MIIEKQLAIQESKKGYSAALKIIKALRWQHEDATLKEASEYEDKHLGTDFIIEFPSVKFACRIRSHKCWFVDVTFRVRRYQNDQPSEKYSEYFKIKNGQLECRYLFYGKWRNEEQDIIDDWIIVDLQTLRNSGLMNIYRRPTWIRGEPEVGFISISFDELYSAGCILNSFLNTSPSYAQGAVI